MSNAKIYYGKIPVGEGKPQVLLDYKEARMAMGAMIDRYK